MEIDLLLPTRGHADRVIEVLLPSIEHTMGKMAEVNLYVYVDCDDVETMKKTWDIENACPDIFCTCVVGQRMCMSAMYNQLSGLGTGDMVMCCADDLEFKGRNWDEYMGNLFMAFPDEIICGYGDDGYWHEKLGTHPFVSRKSIQLLGYLFASNLKRYYCDLYLKELYQKLNRYIYLDHVLIEHNCARHGSAEAAHTEDFNTMLNASDMISREATRLRGYIKRFYHLTR